MCADQARKAFVESDASKKSKNMVSAAEYTSHYDPKANVCYIMVHTMYSFDGGKTVSVGIVVYDAFEGRVYGNHLGSLTKLRNIGKSPQRCAVSNPVDKMK